MCEVSKVESMAFDSVNEPSPVDWSKPLQTRDERKARYGIRIDNPDTPHVVIVTELDGTETAYHYRNNGEWMQLVDVANSLCFGLENYNYGQFKLID
jgi:hypothetical protein